VHDANAVRHRRGSEVHWQDVVVTHWDTPRWGA
jgi:hypothetical protein